MNNKTKFLPAFGTNSIEILNEAGEVINRHTSMFFRDDIKDWHKLIDKIINTFSDKNEINISCFGCSDGSEPFSLAMLLLEKLGIEKVKKCFRIKAFDIEEKIFEDAKNGYVKLGCEDIKRMKEFLGENYKKYIEFDEEYYTDPKHKREVCSGKIKQEVLDAITFKKADIRDELQNIEPKNQVVFCRNFWDYIKSRSERVKLAKNLYSKTDKNSMAVIGDHDILRKQVDQLLLDEGFDICEVDYVYTKSPSNEKDFLTNPEFLMNTFANKK